MSLRLRLTVTYSVLVAVIMAAFSMFLYGTMRFSLQSEMDRRLQVRASQVELTIWPGAGSLSADDITSAKLDLSPLDDLNAPGLYVQVLDTAGRTIATSSNLRGATIPVDEETLGRALAGQRPFSDVAVEQGWLRLLNLPIQANGRTIGVLTVGQSRQPLKDTMDNLALWLTTLSALGLVAAGFIGWFLTRQGLRPLTEMARRASAIARGKDFSQRLGVGDRRDEVGRLARTVDLLLGTVEEMLKQHREFVADTSHELRNPLLALHTNLGMLDQITDPIDRAECIREMEEQIHRMTRLVSELLTLARSEAGLVIERRPVALAPVVERVVRQAAQRAGAGRVLIGELAQVEVLGDEERLTQVVTNLVDNALSHAGAEASVTLNLSREGKWAKLAVVDTGTGIAPEHLRHIFERFYRADDGHASKTGTGLGLAIVKHLTEAHGGRVTAESEMQKGSRFTVWLPARV